MTTLIKWMLFYNRRYVAEKIKAPLRKAIIRLGEGASWLGMLVALIQIVYIAKRYPEPTRQNTVFKNTRIRLDVQGVILGNLKARKALMEVAFRVLNAQCEHDGFYEFIHDIYITELIERGWEPNKRRGWPMHRYWKEQLPKEYCIETNPKWLERRTRIMGSFGSWMDVTISAHTTKSSVVELGDNYDYLVLLIPTMTECKLWLEVAEQSASTYYELGEEVTTNEETFGRAAVWRLGGFKFLKLVSSAAPSADATIRIRGWRT